MPEEKRPLKVFLCHASADKPKVRELYRYLKRRGIQPWLDAENLIPGQAWQVEIPKALNTSDAIIICLTKNSIDKEGYVQKEIRFALEKALEMPEGRIFLIPARLEECDLPYSLRNYQWVDLFEEDGYSKLMRALKLRASQLQRTDVETSGLPTNIEQKDNLAAPIPLPEKGRFEEESAPKPGRAQAGTGEAAGPPRNWNTQIAVAFIGLVGIIIAVLLSSPWIEKRFSPATEPSVTQTFPVPTLTPARPTQPPSPVSSPATETLSPPPASADFVDPAGVPMRPVPVGGFIMGRNANDEFASCQEIYQGCQLSAFMDTEPIRTVYLEAFYIDECEVTNALYKACENQGVCDPPQASNSNSHSDCYGNPEFDQYPVINVSWFQAKTYCEWRGARLPTEAEWEKAARGTDGRTYPWEGEEINENLANYNYSIGDTVAVGSYENGSPYGVYDMAGNVSEWVADWYDENYYQGSPTEDPPGPVTGELRGLRGGSWGLVGLSVSTSHRYAASPSDSSMDLGFRCARSAP